MYSIVIARLHIRLIMTMHWLGSFLVMLLLFQVSHAQVARDTVTIWSEANQVYISSIVIHPDQSSTEPYSVVYLLHGAGGCYTYWSDEMNNLDDLSSTNGVIMVLVDAQGNSWYFDSPVNTTIRMETYVTCELLPYIDSAYHTHQMTQGRAIMGLSMGGHGALFLALRHQELFGWAGSMAGGVDFSTFTNHWDIPSLLGPYKKNKKRWKEHTVNHHAATLESIEVQLMIDCGEDDFFLKGNNALHDILTERGVEHCYKTYPGGHSASYWTARLPDQLAAASRWLK